MFVDLAPYHWCCRGWPSKLPLLSGRRSSFASVSQAEENKVGKGEVMVRQGEEVVLFFTPVEDLSNTDFFSNIGGTRIDEAICTQVKRRRNSGPSFQEEEECDLRAVRSDEKAARDYSTLDRLAGLERR